MTKIMVTKPFKGVPDGQTQPRQFEKGEEVTGDLAEVALKEKWARRSKPRPKKSEAEETPDKDDDDAADTEDTSDENSNENED